MSAPTIDDLKAMQAQLDLRDIHLCWIGPDTFVIAHTDEERASIPLDECDLHHWLADHSEAPADQGYYRVVPHELDVDMEWRSILGPWSLIPQSVAEDGEQ